MSKSENRPSGILSPIRHAHERAASDLHPSDFADLLNTIGQLPTTRRRFNTLMAALSAQVFLPEVNKAQSPLRTSNQKRHIEASSLPTELFTQIAKTVSGEEDPMSEHYPIGAQYLHTQINATDYTSRPTAHIYMVTSPDVPEQLHKSWYDENGELRLDYLNSMLFPWINNLLNESAAMGLFEQDDKLGEIILNDTPSGITSPDTTIAICNPVGSSIQIGTDLLRDPNIDIGENRSRYFTFFLTAGHELAHQSAMAEGWGGQHGREPVAEAYAHTVLPRIFPPEYDEPLSEFTQGMRLAHAEYFFKHHTLALGRNPEEPLGYEHFVLVEWLLKSEGLFWNDFVARMKNTQCDFEDPVNILELMFSNYESRLNGYLGNILYPEGSGNHDNIFDPVRNRLPNYIEAMKPNAEQLIHPYNYQFFIVDGSDPYAHIEARDGTKLITINNRGQVSTLMPNVALRDYNLPNLSATPLVVYNSDSAEASGVRLINDSAPSRLQTIDLPYITSGSTGPRAQSKQAPVSQEVWIAHFNNLANIAQKPDEQARQRENLYQSRLLNNYLKTLHTRY